MGAFSDKSSLHVEVTVTSADPKGEKCLGTTLIPGVRVARVGGTDGVSLGSLLAEPEGTLLAFYCVRGALGLASAEGEKDAPAATPSRVAAGEVLSLLLGASDAEVSVTRAPLEGVALLVSPTEVAPGAAATLVGFGVDVDGLVAATSGRGCVTDAAGTPVCRSFCDLAVGIPGASVAALKLRCVEALRCLCEARLDGSEAFGTEDSAPLSPRAARVRIARAARDLMCANVEVPLTIGELALRCQTSPTVLKESFRAEFGMPVHEWYRRYRMLQAADLLSTGTGSISEVARSVGYSNASKFAQAFSACMGVTPSAWRRWAMTTRPFREAV